VLSDTSNNSRAGSAPRGRQRPFQLRNQIGMVELPVSHIDAQGQALLRQSLAPAPQLPAYGLHRFPAQSDGEPGILGHAQQVAETVAVPSARRQRSTTRIPPACRCQAGRSADTRPRTAACPAPGAVPARAPAGWSHAPPRRLSKISTARRPPAWRDTWQSPRPGSATRGTAWSGPASATPMLAPDVNELAEDVQTAAPSPQNAVGHTFMSAG
jgi:hypothetical protein